MKNQEKIYDSAEDANDELFNQDTGGSRRSYIWAGGIIGILGISGVVAAGTYAWTSNEAKIEAANSLNEGLLRASGFDDNDIAIDISGNTDVITVGCPGTDIDSANDNQISISYMFDAETMVASWAVAPQLDNSGQVVNTYQPIEFQLSTDDEVVGFINNDLVEACSAIASNN